MADLSDLQAAQTVKIAGADSSGIEDNYLEVDSSGRLVVKINDGSGNSLASSTTAPAGTEQALLVRNIPSGTQTVSGTVAATQSGTWNLNNISGTVSLPTGASTSALQTTANSSLSSIDTKTPALGQALAAASVPVVLTAAQLTTLTPLTTIAATQSGTWNITNVSGTVSLPTGASTSALQTTANTSLSSIDAGIPNALGAATTANSMPVNIASDQTVPISASSLPLPTGASTAANQTTANTSLASIDTKTPTLGQKTMANSQPVVIASDQSALKPPADSAVTGTLSALGQSVVINCNGYSTVGWNTTGVWSGTMTMEVQYGDNNWYLVETLDTNISDTGVPSVVTTWTEALNNDPWITNVAGATQARIRFTIYNSGTATINMNASSGINAVRVYNLQPKANTTLSYGLNSTTAIAEAVDTSGNQQIVGNVASGSADSGNPIKVGGVYNTTPPVVTTGQRVDLQVDSLGRLIVSPPYYTFFHPIYTLRTQTVATSNVANSTTLTATITATQANSLIVVTASAVAGTVTCADSAAQSYTDGVTNTSGAKTIHTFYRAASAAGVTTVTITSTSSTALNMIVSEYIDIATVSPLDKVATASVASTSWSSGSTATTTQANELLIGSSFSTSKNNSTWTAGIGWTSTNTTNGFNAAAGAIYQEDQYVSATSAYTATGTISASDTILSSISTFKISPAPANLVIPNTASIIKSGAGTLHAVTVNTPGTGGATLTLYDGLSSTGTIIAVILLTTPFQQFMYNASFTTGLTMVVNSTTADFTVTYV